MKRSFPNIRAPDTEVWVVILLLLLASGLPGTVLAGNWETLQTKYLVLKYQDPGDLRQVDKQITYSKIKTSGFTGFFSGSSGLRAHQLQPKKLASTPNMWCHGTCAEAGCFFPSAWHQLQG